MAGVANPEDRGAAHPLGERESARPARSLSRRGPWLALLVYAVLAVLLTLPVWLSPLSRFIGLSTDPKQTIWFLSWVPFALGHHQNPLLSDYWNYPRGFNLLWNTAIPAAGFILWPITAVWGSVATYNVIMTVGPILASWFAFLAIRRHIRSDVAAAIGGLVYGFSPCMVAQLLGHAHIVLSAMTPPVVLILLDELLARQRRRPAVLGLALAAVLVLQFFIAEEVFTTEIVMAITLSVLLAVTYRSEVRAKLPYALHGLGAAVAALAIVLAYPAYLQFLGPDRLSGAIHPPTVDSTDVLNLVIPTPVQLVAPSGAVSIASHFTSNLSEWNGYLGIPLLISIAVVAIRYWRVRFIRVASLMVAITVIYAFGPNLHVEGHVTSIPLPWWVPAHLPLLDDVLPGRMTMYAFLAAGMCLAFVLQRLSEARGSPWPALAVAALVIASLLPRMPLASRAISHPSYFRSTAVEQLPYGSVAVTVPWASPLSADPVLWQVEAGLRFRIVGGYALGPISTAAQVLHVTIDRIAAGRSVPALEAGSRALILRELHRIDVGAVIVGPSPHQSASIEFFSGLLGFQPQTHDGVDVWLLTCLPGGECVPRPG